MRFKKIHFLRLPLPSFYQKTAQQKGQKRVKKGSRRQMENITAKNFLALADALNIGPRELL
jgi:hypothetical protein